MGSIPLGGSLTGGCSVRPRGGIGSLFELDSLLRERLGCPVIAERSELLVEQLFESGHMLWRPQTGQLLIAFFGEGRFVSHAGEPTVASVDSVLSPPTGLVAPGGQFGRLWRDIPGLRDRLGWAVSVERGFSGVAQDFPGGTMVWTGAGQRLIRTYYADGTTVYVPDPARP